MFFFFFNSATQFRSWQFEDKNLSNCACPNITSAWDILIVNWRISWLSPWAWLSAVTRLLVCSNRDVEDNWCGRGLELVLILEPVPLPPFSHAHQSGSSQIPCRYEFTQWQNSWMMHVSEQISLVKGIRLWFCGYCFELLGLMYGADLLSCLQHEEYSLYRVNRTVER